MKFLRDAFLPAILAAFLVTGCEPTDDAAGPDSTAVTPDTPEQATRAELFRGSSNFIAGAKDHAVFSQFRPVQQVQLVPEANSLKVNATGDDPQFLLPAFAAGKKFVIEAIVQSPAATEMQIFYQLRGQNGYSESQMQTAPLSPGRNKVYFLFDADEIIDPLRVDIGATPGTYVVESMLARALPGR